MNEATTASQGGRPRSQEAQELGRALTSTERSRKRRSRLKLLRLKKGEVRPKAYKYYLDRAASPQERKQRWKAKKQGKGKKGP